MSSLVIFEKNGVVASWNKDGPYTIRIGGENTRKNYPTEIQAIRAAKRYAAKRTGTPATPDIHDVIRLARAFGEEVQAAFSVGEFHEICDRNKSRYADSSICATHDFCDANMLMLDAWTKTFGREPQILIDANDCEADAKLWGDAWAVAKAAEFFA